MTAAADNFTLGLAHHRAGRLDDAARHYRKALEADPDFPGALLNLAVLCMGLQKYDEAFSLFERARARDPDNASILVNLGNLSQLRGDPAEAERCYRAALAAKPDLAEAHVNLGNLFFKQDRPDAAAAFFRAGLDINPMIGQAHANLGAALVALGQDEEAARELAIADALGHRDATLHFTLGGVHFRRRDFTKAAEHYAQAIALAPGWTRAQVNLAASLRRQGKDAESIAAYRQALAQEPDAQDVRRGLAAVLIDHREWDEAEALLHAAAAAEPNHAETEFHLGSLYIARGDMTRAVEHLERAVTTVGGAPEAHNNLGHALQQMGRHADALRQFDLALATNPDFASALNNRGNSLAATGNPDEALVCYRRAVELDPALGTAQVNLGNALRSRGDLDAALACFEAAIAAHPDLHTAYNGYGLTLQTYNRHDDAIAAYKTAIELNPHYPEALNNLAISYQDQGRYSEAVACYLEVIDHNPHMSAVYFNMGSLLQVLSRHDEAVTAFRKAREQAPHNPAITPYLVHGLMQQCSWKDLGPLIEEVLQNTVRQLDDNTALTISPFGLQSLPASHELRCRTARYVSGRIKDHVRPIREALGPLSYAPAAGRKLRVGFISPDFRFHSVAVAFREILLHRDREKFDYYGYALTTYGQDEMTRYFKSAFDKFQDITSLSYADAAKLINADGVDILIDLAGHTRGGRLEIFALRPAPIQAHWLGFSSTIGADFLDYLIQDRHQIPPDEQHLCSEKLVYLPDTFMATSRPTVAPDVITRVQCGLPETGFVFANFNSHYKFYPTLFSTWMRLLRQVPGSVLWLLSGTRTSRQNLRAEAEARGIDPSRLVFSDTVGHPIHLARLVNADLSLDNLYHGGGVTTTDALYMGVPVLTLAGDAPPARNGATLINAIGLPELITHSLKDYEAAALDYARNPEKISALKAKLRANRDTTALFDTPRLVRHLEKAFELMWENHAAGNPPRMIEVPDLARS